MKKQAKKVSYSKAEAKLIGFNILVYGIKFAFIWVVASFFFLLLSNTPLFYYIETINAQNAAFISSPFVPNLVVEGNQFYSNESKNYFVIEVGESCLGWYPSILFLALIMALPISLKKIIKPLILGLIIILGVNLLRISILMIIGHYFGENLFDFFHTIILRYDLVFLIIGLFLISIKYFIGIEYISKEFKKSRTFFNFLNRT